MLEISDRSLLRSYVCLELTDSCSHCGEQPFCLQFV